MIVCVADSCPCGSGCPFKQCCGLLLTGDRQAETAEQLMRSRYTAYVRGDTNYLERTWHHTTRPTSLQPGGQQDPQWKSLTILSTGAGTTDDSEGTVEFLARYKLNGRAGKLHENSRFVKHNGHWYYLDGDSGQ